MALSMFLRAPACLNPAFRQSVAWMSTQPSAMQRLASSNLPAATMLLKESASLLKAVKSTPILNSVRPLRTSAPARTFAKDEHPHDHARLWVIEKATTALLVPLIPISLMFPNKICDVIVAVLVTVHSFWGLEAIAVDYVRAALFGPIIPKIAIALVYAISIATLGGLLYLISHDVGLGNAVRALWSVKADNKNA